MPSIHLSVTDRDTIAHAVRDGRSVLTLETAEGLYTTLTVASDDVLASLAAHIELVRSELHAAQLSRRFGEDRAS